MKAAFSPIVTRPPFGLACTPVKDKRHSDFKRVRVRRNVGSRLKTVRGFSGSRVGGLFPSVAKRVFAARGVSEQGKCIVRVLRNVAVVSSGCLSRLKIDCILEARSLTLCLHFSFS